MRTLLKKLSTAVLLGVSVLGMGQSDISVIQWQKTIGGAGQDIPSKVLPITGGGYLLGGGSSSNVSGDKTENSRGGYDYWIVKLNAQGQIQWDKTIGGNGGDYITSIVQTADGGYLLGGHSNSGISGEKTENSRGSNVVQNSIENIDYWIVKLNAQGQIQWDKTIGGSNEDKLYSVIQTADGGYLLGGNSISNSSGEKTENSRGSSDYWIVKLNAQGQIQWDKTIGGNGGDSFSSGNIIQSADGGYLLGGYSYSNNSGEKTENSKGGSDYWIIKLNAQGQIQWDKTIGGSSSDYLSSIIQTSDGSYLLGGDSYSGVSGEKTENSRGGGDYWIVKLNAQGQIQWDKTIGGSNEDNLYSVIQTADGGYLLGGNSRSNSSAEKTENSRGSGDYWIVKLKNPNYQISGNVYLDANQDCINTNETPKANQLMKGAYQGNSNNDVYTRTDAQGNYTLYAWESGAYSVQTVNPWFAGNPSCFTAPTIVLDSPVYFVQNVNLPMIINYNCPALEVSNTTPFLRRCFDNTYYINYKNTGFAAANNSYVDVTLDSNMTFVNGSIPSMDLGNGIRRFNLGTVNGESQGNFNYTVYLACGDSTILGQTHCVEAHIYPDSACIPVPNTANIVVESECEGDSILFRILNKGTNTSPQLRYYVFEDDIMLFTAPIQINAQQQVEIRRRNNGQSTYRLETTNPMASTPYGRLWGASIPSSSVEGCGATGSFNTGFVTRFSTPDDQPWLDIDCQQNGGSYDPNDKTGYPLGLTSNHYITANDAIEYKIRFQNTGTDTAFTVVIRDTLDSDLDPSTIQFGASSHPYTAQLYGSGYLTFTFNTINLVDSFTNEPASNGFVSFKIWQKANNPVGTLINNTASIYFDFNAPIVTNTTQHEINHQNRAFFVGIEENKSASLVGIQVFPNPFEESATLVVGTEALDHFTVKVYNLAGQVLQSQSYENTNQATIYRNNLTQGIYIYQIEQKGQILNIGKVVIK